MASHVPYIVITPCDETLDTGIVYYELEINVIFSATYIPKQIITFALLVTNNYVFLSTPNN